MIAAGSVQDMLSHALDGQHLSASHSICLHPYIVPGSLIIQVRLLIAILLIVLAQAVAAALYHKSALAGMSHAACQGAMPRQLGDC
jgi:hypothetical protein